MKAGRIFKGDRIIWVVFFLLSIFSLVEVYSSIGLEAYSHPAGSGPTGLFLKHLVIVIATYIAIILISRINYRVFSRFAVMGYWISIVLLGVVMVLGVRWLKIPHVGQFQPSEIAKVILIIFVARVLTLRRENIKELGTFIMLLVYIGIVAGMVLFENFSTAALIFLTCFLMMIFGGVKRSYWWRLLLVGLVAVTAFLAFNYYKYRSTVETGNVQEVTIERQMTWGHRVYSWIHPNPEELTQENMARMAVARGGLLGVGVGNTVHARLMTQAHNDFIYAIIIEETGLLGGIIVFMLYSILYFRCIRLAWRCKGRFGALTVAGMGTVIYLQALVNMCVAVGVLPVTGQTLPFISFGGTAYLFLGCGLGVIQAVAADVEKQDKEEFEKGTKITEKTEEIENQSI